MSRKKCIVLILAGLPAAFVVVLLAALAIVVHGGATIFPLADPVPPTSSDKLQIVAVQMHWSLADYADEEAFKSKIDGLIQEGMEQVEPGFPVLFVFPELLGAPLYLLGDYDLVKNRETFAEAMEGVITHTPVGVLFYMARFGVGPARALCLTKGKTAGRVYVETFSEAARRHRVYISAGSIPLPDFPLAADGSRIDYDVVGPEVYNVSYFFGPDGRIIGRQNKVHLTELEKPHGLDLTPGAVEDLTVVNLPNACIGVAVCWDAFHKDVVERLIAQGADILVEPSANPGEWSEKQQEDWLNGAWREVQRRPQLRCAVNPMMTGNLFDLVFEGQSAVIVPEKKGDPRLSYAAMPETHGFLALASTPNGEEVLVTVLE
ncbi:MAG: nitrilase-related carbon-nitrogen hydrolase [Candidatus Hydrogenedentota bacterium]